MKSFQEHLQIINTFHELGETIAAAQFLIEEYGLENPNFKGFELRKSKTRIYFDDHRRRFWRTSNHPNSRKHIRISADINAQSTGA